MFCGDAVKDFYPSDNAPHILAVLLPFVGPIVDIFGRKGPILIAQVLTIIGLINVDDGESFWVILSNMGQ